MFKRRTPLPVFSRLREWIWPSMGFGRALTYLKHRIIRFNDTPHSIAAGLAMGVAISFSPLIGTHFVQVMIICFVLRFNVLAAFLGTVIGNPTTFPFIWAVSYALGHAILGFFGIGGPQSAPGEALPLEGLWESFESFSHIFWPWMLGGYILCFLIWFPAYFMFKSLIEGARVARETAKMRLRTHQAHKVAKEVTGQKK